MSALSRRVGLTQRVDDIAGRDERRDALDQAWTEFLALAGAVPVPIPNRLAGVAGFVDSTQLDLLVLTGANDVATLPGAEQPAPERDAIERSLLGLARQRALPLLGVC